MYTVVRGWYPDPDDVLLNALRTQYSYDIRWPGRATGWLYSARQQGQLAPMEWPEPLAEPCRLLLLALRLQFGITFSAACFQAYLDGTGCDWHADHEWDAQAILSLGVTRGFGLRRGSGRPEYLTLSQGDLLIMPSGFQGHWEHCVPVEKQAHGERCSIVFRYKE